MCQQPRFACLGLRTTVPALSQLQAAACLAARQTATIRVQALLCPVAQHVLLLLPSPKQPGMRLCHSIGAVTVRETKRQKRELQLYMMCRLVLVSTGNVTSLLSLEIALLSVTMHESPHSTSQ